MNKRTVNKVTTPRFQRGFLGEGHHAAAVVDGSNFADTDPFIILMDDQLDLPGGQPVGGAHPHAGFETVTLVLEGNAHTWQEGTLELMTAGKGIVHTEEIDSKTKVRILQLWLVLPPDKRWAEPFFQKMLLEDVPTHRDNTGEIRVYSGTSNGLTSPLQNQTPFTLVDFKVESEKTITQLLPATYNGFVYVVDGTVMIGDQQIRKGQVAWFGRSTTPGDSEIDFTTSTEGARFVLYAGEPQHAPIVSHGPFIGDNDDDIRRLYREYREGKMPHVDDLPPTQRIQHRAAVVS